MYTVISGPVAQLVRAPPCHGGGRGFEPHPGRLFCLKRVIYIWDHSSAGRASALQAEGHRFEPYRPHSHVCVRNAAVAEQADAQDLKSCGTYTPVPVRFRSTALSTCYRCCLISYVGVAQLDRASGYGPEGREFESSRPRKNPYKSMIYRVFYLCTIRFMINVRSLWKK